MSVDRILPAAPVLAEPRKRNTYEVDGGEGERAPLVRLQGPAMGKQSPTLAAAGITFPRPCCACGEIVEKFSGNAVPCEKCKCHWDSFLGTFGGAFMSREEADEQAKLFQA